MDRRTALSTWLHVVLASNAVDVEDRVVVSDIVHRMGMLPAETRSPTRCTVRLRRCIAPA